MISTAGILAVDVEGWLSELPAIEQHYAKFGDRLPKALQDELAALKSRLEEARG